MPISISRKLRRIPIKSRLLWMALLVTFTLSSACSHKVNTPYAPALDEFESERPVSISLDLESGVGDTPGVAIGDISFFEGRSVVLDPPHDQWLFEGLKREFERAGFLVHEEPGADYPHVSVRHVDFAGEVVARDGLGDRGAAVAAFDVEVTIDDPEFTFQRRFASTSLKERRRGLDGDHLEQLLREALTDVYAEMVVKTHALLVEGSLH